MMKKTILHAAVLAGLAAAGSAQAVHVNPDGLGQVLLYPYYTVQNGFDTYVHVVNTTDTVKAVKVRFLEGKNSQEVLDFNLYLSPRDEWTGVITKTDTGAKLTSADTSCVAPASLAAGVDFRNFQYLDDAEALRTLERTREGYIEVIEMGELVKGTTLATAAIHVNDVPANCDAIRAAAKLTTSELNANNPAVIVAPGGGLYGFGSLINVAGGSKSSIDAVALDNFRETTAIHFTPGNTSPSLNNGNSAAGGVIVDGAVVTNFIGQSSIDDVSAVLMRDVIANDYVVDAERESKTDWVITFPTKRFYVNDQSQVIDGEEVAIALPPFESPWNPVTGRSCDEIEVAYWNREEKVHIVTVEEDFSPKPEVKPDSNVLCNEVNTLTVKPAGATDDYASLFGAQFTNASFSLADGFNYGWMAVNLGTTGINELVDDAGTTMITGLPVIGFAAIANTNGTLVDVNNVNVLSNYMGTTTHKSTRLISD